MALLSSQEITERLSSLTDWHRQGETIRREYDFEDFVEAVEFTNDLVSPAEEHNHHPDLEVSWGSVVVNLMTHDQGGLTEKDFKLASIIDEIYQEEYQS